MNARLACAAALLVLAGCAITAKDDPQIPRVTPALVAGAATGTTRIQLEHGRETYTRECTACHEAEPVRKYSLTRWREIVNDMADRADMPSEPRAALMAYIAAVVGKAP
jgi:hypothetical protein